MKKMNSAFTGAVNKVKAMNAMEQKAKQVQEVNESEEQRELPRLKRADSNIVDTDIAKVNTVDNGMYAVDVLPAIVGNGQLYGIGERQEFIEGIETKLAWGTPRQNTVI